MTGEMTSRCCMWSALQLHVRRDVASISTLCIYVQAIALLHPEGPTAAAADEAREAAEAEQAAAAAARHPSKVAKLALRQGSAMGEGTPSGTPRTGSGMAPRLGSSAFPGTQLAGPSDTPSCTDADDFQVSGHVIAATLLP